MVEAGLERQGERYGLLSAAWHGYFLGVRVNVFIGVSAQSDGHAGSHFLAFEALQGDADLRLLACFPAFHGVGGQRACHRGDLCGVYEVNACQVEADT